MSIVFKASSDYFKKEHSLSKMNFFIVFNTKIWQFHVSRCFAEDNKTLLLGVELSLRQS